MQEIDKGAMDFNIPIVKANRELVASINGGLKDPSVLVFDPNWGIGRTIEKKNRRTKEFKYPSLTGIYRPKNEEDIAFMSVSKITTFSQHWEKNLRFSAGV